MAFMYVFLCSLTFHLFSLMTIPKFGNVVRCYGLQEKKDSIFKCQIFLIVRLLIQAFPQLISCLTYGHESEWTEDTKSMLHGPTISLLIQCFHFFSCTTCTYRTVSISFGHTTYQNVLVHHIQELSRDPKLHKEVDVISITFWKDTKIEAPFHPYITMCLIVVLHDVVSP